jgi:hypothetical protein
MTPSPNWTFLPTITPLPVLGFVSFAPPIFYLGLNSLMAYVLF